MDIVFLLLLAALAASNWGLLVLCERLRSRP
jgi:hypothetical protein